MKKIVSIIAPMYNEEGLVHQYCEDEAFMKKRKEACRRKAEEILAVDEKENYRRLCEFVETYTVEQEKQAQHLDGR